MISEVAFARDFPSFWRVVTPTMEGFVRRLNAGLYDRDFEPMKTGIRPNRRAFINEVAFEVFCRVVTADKTERMRAAESIPEAAHFVSTGRMPVGSDYQELLSSEEVEDAKEQVRRLVSWFTLPATKGIRCRLRFPGCGIIDSCQGDVFAGNTLYEIKAGDRTFRSIDIRQLLVYLTLNHVGRSYPIRAVGLVNPRNGVSIEMSATEFCFECSGQDVNGLLGAIAYRISSGDISG